MSKKYLINEDPIVSKYIDGVRHRLKSRLKNIYLFGSRARGEAWEGSDYDIAIIVDDRDRKLEEMILDVSTLILDQFDALISTQIFTEDEWKLERKLPLGINILKEGIAF
jgi:predicted nucleotidyltransferase